MFKNYFILIITFLVLTSCAETEKKEKDVILTGKFTYTGNAPFQKLAFRTDKGMLYEVNHREKVKLNPVPVVKVKIKATAGYLVMETADGKIKRKVYYIKNIKFIKE